MSVSQHSMLQSTVINTQSSVDLGQNIATAMREVPFLWEIDLCTKNTILGRLEEF